MTFSHTDLPARSESPPLRNPAQPQTKSTGPPYGTGRFSPAQDRILLDVIALREAVPSAKHVARLLGVDPEEVRHRIAYLRRA